MDQTHSAPVSGLIGLPTLDGQTVRLRPLRVEDLDQVAEIQAEPSVARWWGPPDKADIRRKANGVTDEKAFVIERDGELVGLIQYLEENEPDFRHAGIDLFLAERAHGRGLGTDAIRTLARYLIQQRGHHRLTIDPAADNSAAIRAYEKVGSCTVGVMREYWRSPDGTWRDGLLMDLLAHEFDPAWVPASPSKVAAFGFLARGTQAEIVEAAEGPDAGTAPARRDPPGAAEGPARAELFQGGGVVASTEPRARAQADSYSAAWRACGGA